MILITREGRHYRVCDAAWQDSLDTTFSRRDGGRWNAPGSFGVLHLNASIDVAAANARKQYDGEIHTLFDLELEFQPLLVEVHVRPATFIDCISASGLRAAGLPSSYPTGVSWVRTRDTGRKAYDQRAASGIACRSAVVPSGEELAVFDRSLDIVRPGKRHRFAAWYPPLRAVSRRKR